MQDSVVNISMKSITPEQTKKLLIKKRKQLEVALIKNRYNILVEITKSKPKFNQKTWKLRLTGKLEGLFQTMKENSIIEMWHGLKASLLAHKIVGRDSLW